jgi:hypothetical protein
VEHARTVGVSVTRTAGLCNLSIPIAPSRLNQVCRASPVSSQRSRFTSRLACHPQQNLVPPHAHLNVCRPRASFQPYMTTVVYQPSCYAFLRRAYPSGDMLAAMSANWTYTAMINVGAEPMPFSAPEQHSMPLPRFAGEPSGACLRFVWDQGFAINLESRTLPHGPTAAYIPPRAVVTPLSPDPFPCAHSPARASRNFRMPLYAA